MSLASNLLPVVDRLRGLADTLGFRPFTVEIIRRTYADPFSGAAPTETTLTALTNAGKRPKVRMIDENDYARGYPQDAEIEVGPITPPYTGGGTSYDTLEQLAAEDGSEIYYKVTGPGFASGVRFAKVEFNGERALAFTVLLRRISDGES